jgi:hypothetical protein
MVYGMEKNKLGHNAKIDKSNGPLWLKIWTIT